jgi:hypothetical protein
VLADLGSLTEGSLTEGSLTEGSLTKGSLTKGSLTKGCTHPTTRRRGKRDVVERVPIFVRFPHQVGVASIDPRRYGR